MQRAVVPVDRHALKKITVSAGILEEKRARRQDRSGRDILPRVSRKPAGAPVRAGSAGDIGVFPDVADLTIFPK